MSTHFLSSSNPIDIYITNTIKISNIPSNTQVTLLEEGVGIGCGYHLVNIDNPELSSYNNSYMVSVDVVYPMDGTRPMAPRVCIPQNEYESSYEPPKDWFNDINTPFLNKKDQKYYITVISNYKTLDNMFSLKEDAIKEGIKRILGYYFRENSDQVISSVLSYYSFANFEQYYVPFEPNLRIRCQISIPRKFIEAIPMKELDTKDSTSTTGYYLKDVSNKLETVATLLEQYQRDIIFYNVKFKNINLTDDAKSLRKFRKVLQKYFNLNNIKTYERRGFVEFSINNCYDIQNVSYCNEKKCEYVKIGLSSLKNSAPFNNPSIVYLISQLDAISQIRYCDTPWYEFLNNFYYPKQNIKPMQNPLEKFEKGIYDSLLNFPSDIYTNHELALKIETNFGLLYSGFQDGKKLTTEERFVEAQKKLLKNFRNNLILIAGNKILTEEGITEYLSDITKDNIIEKLKEIKICELSLQALECLGSLISIQEINEQINISFTYKEQKNDLIPYLTQEEKRILFRKILKDKAINRQTINRLIEKFETDKMILVSTRTQPMDRLIETLINYMVA